VLSNLPTENRIPVKPSKNTLKITIISYNTADLFSLSPELLNHYAPNLFNAAKMTTDGICYFNDVDAQVFKYSTKWLYHQPYFDCGSFDEKFGEVDEDYDCQYYELGPLYIEYNGDATVLVAKLYLFASKYEIPQLQKDAIDRLVMCVDMNPV
jgi:hypothetical protein